MKRTFTQHCNLPVGIFKTIIRSKCLLLFLFFLFAKHTVNAQVDICDPFCPEFCDIVQNTQLSIDEPCPFALDLGSVLTVSVDGDASISCGTDKATITTEMTLLKLAGDELTDSVKINSLIPPVICDLLDGVGTPEIDLGIVTIPELPVIPSFFPDGVTCNSNLVDLILGLINEATGSVSAGQEPGGRLLVADTDGNGSFDLVIDRAMGDPRLSGSFTVTNNVRGNGCITVRGINSYPVPPLDFCGLISVDISLLTLLEPLIGAIPVAGPIIITVLNDLECDANLSFVASDDHVIQVESDQPPIFINCPSTTYVFSDDGSCTDPVNWSIPIAMDNCTGEVLTFMGAGPVGTEPGVWQTAGPTVGTDLGVGVHEVTYTARGCENTTECTFQIIVEDNNPLLVCPSDLIVGTDVDVCTRLIKGLVPLSGQSCVSTITYGVSGATTIPAGLDFTDLQNGVTFNPGTSTVTYTLTVDLNNDGDVSDNVNGVAETQTCSFDITVEDNERPFASCKDIDVQLDETGQVQIFASDQVASYLAGMPFVDGGSADNCTDRENLIIRINDQESLIFDCSNIGTNFINLSVYDLNHNADGTFATGARNIRTCIAQINVIDYFENYVVELDVPEVCFDNGPQTIDFAQYLTIRKGDGTLLTHAQVLADPTLNGVFDIQSAASLNGGFGGTLTPDGVYNPSESIATSNLTFEYTLSLAANSSCNVKGRSTFELRQPQDVNEAVCHCPNNNNYREVNLGDYLGDDNGSGGFFPKGQSPYTIQYTGGILTNGDGTTIIDQNQNGTIIYDYAYLPGTTTDANGAYWGSGNILDDDNTPNDLTNNPVIEPLLAPRNQTGEGNGVFNLGSLVPVDPGADGMIGTNDDVLLDGNWSFTIVDARGCEIFRSGSCASLVSNIDGPSGPVCITDPVLTYHDIRTNPNLSNAPSGIPACETVTGGATHDITWELSTTIASGATYTIDIATIPGGTIPAGTTDVIPDNAQSSVLTVFQNGVVELNPVALRGTNFGNGGDFLLRMYVDRHACFDPTDTDSNSATCTETFETSIVILPEFDPKFVTPNDPVCINLVDDATTDDGDAFNPMDDESKITLCLEDIVNILAVFEDLEPILDASGQIIEENVYITWSGPGIVDLNDGTISDNDGTNTGTDGPGRTNGAGNTSTGCATFDPSVAGEGTHTITVEVGYDNCRRTFSQTITVKPISSAELRDDYSICSSQAGQVNLTVLFNRTTHGGEFSLVSAYGYGQNVSDNNGVNDGTFNLDDVDLTGDINRNGIIDVSVDGDVLQYESDTQQPLSASDAPINVCVAYGVGCDFSLLGTDYIQGNTDDYTGVELVAALPAATPPPPSGNFKVVATPQGTAPIFSDRDNDGYVSVNEIVQQFIEVNPITTTYDVPTRVADIVLILSAMEAAQPCFVFDLACFTINNGHEADLDLPAELYSVRGQDTLLQLYRFTSIEDVNLSALIVEEPNGDLDPGEIQFILAAVNGQTRLTPTTTPRGFAPGTAGVPNVFTVDSDNDGVYTPGIDLDMMTVISTKNCDSNRQFGPTNPTAPASEFCPMLDLGVLHSICEPVNLKIRLQYNNAECIKIAEDTILKLYEIPTMTQWGLLIFVLLLFNLRIVFAYRQQLVLEGNTNFSLQVVPFNKNLFAKYFMLINLTLFALFIGCHLSFDYELMPFDLIGSILTAGLIAYMLQLLGSGNHTNSAKKGVQRKNKWANSFKKYFSVLILFGLAHNYVSAQCTINAPASTDVCVGDMLQLTGSDGTTANATWTSSNTTLATVSNTGLVEGLADGAVTITYSDPDCPGVGDATIDLMINALPAFTTQGLVDICQGTITTFAVNGVVGTWSTTTVSGGGMITIADPVIGAAEGSLAGVASLIFTETATGCMVSQEITIRDTAVISGPGLVCVNQEITLSATGTKLSNLAWAEVTSGLLRVINNADGTATVTGIKKGAARVRFTEANGCQSFRDLTVQEPTITANKTDMCLGASDIMLTSEGIAGTWSVVGTAVTIGSSTATTATLNGAAVGMAKVAYEDNDGCTDTIEITVHEAMITGTLNVCVGNTTNLDGNGGIANTNPWVSSDTDVAEISNTGLVTGKAVGMVTITYTDRYGCEAMEMLIVSEASITAPDTALCMGEMVTFIGLGSGVGTWESSNTGTAEVDAAGEVTAKTAGIATITYTDAAGCEATQVITITNNPTILGVAAACSSGSINLTANAIPATTDPWVSSMTGVATIDNNGAVTPVGMGTTIITFTDINGCTATQDITINADATITGNMELCVGETTTLTGSGVPAAVNPWFSNDISVVSVSDLGLATAISPGTATITYTDANNCPINFSMTVHANPVMTGDDWVCVGLTTTLDIGAGTATDTWTSSMTGVATVDGDGVVTGIAMGTTLITYTNDNDCTDTMTVTVHGNPSITGEMDVCIDSTILLTGSGIPAANNTSPWVSKMGNIASVINTIIGTPPTDVISIGKVKGLMAGMSEIIYTDINGCMDTLEVTVHDPMITGSLDICVGHTSQLVGTGNAPNWTSSNTLVATVSNSGLVTGVAGGTSIITYRDATGCPITVTVTIYENPVISGADSVCVGSTVQLSADSMPIAPTAWRSLDITLATVNNTGLVTGVADGTVGIVFTDFHGCEDTLDMQVNALPIITGDDWVCVDATLQLTGTATKALTDPWVSEMTSIATVDDNGLVTGKAEGTVDIIYTNIFGCKDTLEVTVHPNPVLTRDTTICVDVMEQIIVTPNNPAAVNPWVSSNTAVLTVTNTGIMEGQAPGTSLITFTNINGCTDTMTVTVFANPVITSTKTVVCVDETLQLTASGTPATTNPWVSSDPSVATIDDHGLVTGKIIGSTDVTYTDINGCQVTVTINSNDPQITGVIPACFTGELNIDGVGTPHPNAPWKSANEKIARVDFNIATPNQAVVVGLIPGTVDIIFIDSDDCTDTVSVTICEYPTGACEIPDVLVADGDKVIMPTDSSAIVAQLISCADITRGVQFVDDGTIDNALYADQSKNGGERSDTVVLCPQDKWHAVAVTFTDFDIAPGDGLSVYEGNLCAVQGGLRPFITKKNGTGVSSSPGGGWLKASCDPACNPSGCLTFIFETDDTNVKATGWDAWVTCFSRSISLEVNIENIAVTCEDVIATVEFDKPSVVQGCGGDANLPTIDGTYIFDLFDNKGERIVRYNKIHKDSIPPSQALPVGNYYAHYKLFSDTTKEVAASFSVFPPTLTCNDELTVAIGSGCGISISPDDLLEDPCIAYPKDKVQYKVIAELGTGDKQIIMMVASDNTGTGSDQLPLLNIPLDTLKKAGVDVCTGEFIAKVERSFIHNGAIITTEICETKVKIRDNTTPFVQLTFDPTVIIELTAGEINELLTFKTLDNCDENTNIDYSVRLSPDVEPCFDNGGTKAIITFSATDVCGNASGNTTKEIPVKRSDRFVLPKDATAACEDTNKDPGIPGLVKGYYQGSQFTALDTIYLNTQNHVNGYVSQKAVEPLFSSTCGRKENIVWKIVDWCAPQTRPTIFAPQLLTYIDSVPPVITLENETFTRVETKNILTDSLLVFKLDSESCNYDVTGIAPPKVTDNCDETPSIYLHSIGSITKGLTISKVTGKRDSITSIENLPQGNWGQMVCDTFRMMYIASDTCNEQTLQDTIYRFIAVVDEIAPVALCRNRVNISLGSNKIVSIDASHINHNSRDNCEIDTIGIRLDGTTDDFTPFIDLTCESGSTVQVELQVIDHKGNEDYCWCELNIEDKTISTIIPPKDTIESSCDLYHTTDFVEGDITGTDLMTKLDNDFGKASVSSNCEIKNISQSLNIITRDCEFMVERTFSITNWDDAVSSATQLLIFRSEPNWELHFPADTTITCGQALDDNIPPPATLEDIIVKVGSCNSLSINIDEQKFVSQPDACFKVLRTYTIWNNCGNEGETYTVPSFGVDINVLTSEITNAQVISYTQTIIAENTEGPSVFITNPSVEINGSADKGETGPCSLEKSFVVYAKDCLDKFIAEKDLEVNLKDSNGNNIAINSTTYVDGKLTANATVQTGDYEMEVKASDGCGNSSVETSKVTFIDVSQPSIFGLTGITSKILPTSKTLEIWASDLVTDISDYCDEENQIKLVIWHSSLGAPPSNCEIAANLESVFTFTCDYTGFQTVRVYAIDASGNCSFLESTVEIQDTDNVCSGNVGGTPDGTNKIAGKLISMSGELMSHVDIEIEGAYLDTIATSATGAFEAEMTQGESYTIRPMKDNGYLNGVSTYDLLLISKHILKRTPFTSPYQYIAADINNNGTVSVYDMIILRKLILSISKDLAPFNTSWRFVDDSFDFNEDFDVALTESFPESKLLNNLNKDELNNNFVGIKIGDISGNASPNDLVVAEDRNSINTFTLSASNRAVRVGETIRIDFTAKDIENVEGYQFTLNYQDLEFTALEEGIVKKENFNTSQDGIIITSWNGKAASNEILFTLVFKGKNAGQLSDLIQINSEIANAEAYDTDGEILGIDLVFVRQSDKPELFQNTPNPFNNRTQIGFYLPQAGEATIKLLDTNGKLIKTITSQYKAGNQNVELFAKDLSANGILFYQLEFNGSTSIRKMLILN